MTNYQRGPLEWPKGGPSTDPNLTMLRLERKKCVMDHYSPVHAGPFDVNPSGEAQCRNCQYVLAAGTMIKMLLRRTDYLERQIECLWAANLMRNDPAWSIARYPGDPVRMITFEHPETKKIGDVRIQWYGSPNHSMINVRVGAFLPGVLIESPGDTPKTEPDLSEWANDKAIADAVFDRYCEQARTMGWKEKAS